MILILVFSLGACGKKEKPEKPVTNGGEKDQGEKKDDERREEFLVIGDDVVEGVEEAGPAILGTESFSITMPENIVYMVNEYYEYDDGALIFSFI